MFEACTPATNKQANTGQTETANEQTEPNSSLCRCFLPARDLKTRSLRRCFRSCFCSSFGTRRPPHPEPKGKTPAQKFEACASTNEQTDHHRPSKPVDPNSCLGRGPCSCPCSCPRSCPDICLLQVPASPNLHRKEAAFRTCAVVLSTALIWALLISSVGCFGPRRTRQTYPAKDENCKCRGSTTALQPMNKTITTDSPKQLSL